MRKTCLLALLVVLSSVANATTTTYTGEAVVRSLAPTRVAVFLDTDGDHMVDNGFLLTTDIPMHDGLSVHLPAAKLVFTFLSPERGALPPASQEPVLAS